jgi:hypothetical protein
MSNISDPHRGEFSDLYRLSYNIYPIAGFALTVLISIVGSLLLGGLKDSENVDERLISPTM